MNTKSILGPLVAWFLLTGCTSDEPAMTETAVDACASDELMLHVPSPDWRDQVIYMMFIDRFDDGDPSNNDQGYDEYRPELNTHFSGGDLQGMINRVDYLKELGITSVWYTPPVMNQWWSTPYQATGWHGYWATNFREIDPHFGDLDKYKELVHTLHCNGMYAIQDIVANHTANWYTWDGEYDPNDKKKGFRLLEQDSHQPAPTQSPFDMIDLNNPEHEAAAIYHFTPEIDDFSVKYQVYNWMLGLLADVNTENPVVIAELKDTYRYWIEEVGVDAYRIDTVTHVPPEFWQQFANDPDGIYPFAAGLGKERFLSFGESFSISDPFDDYGERTIAEFFGNEQNPGLNSMLSFPLYFEINRVMARGEPTAQLQYRLEKMMEIYPDPFVMPTFVDNHDTPRFLASGHTAALKQALTTIFTVPGIPIIYQGTEQGMDETRMAMFAGGHRNAEGSFNPEHEVYRFIRRLADFRKANLVLTRGDLSVLASDESGPGLIAWRRDYEGDTVYVLMNTADHSILVNELDIGLQATTELPILLSNVDGPSPVTSSNGELSLKMRPRQILVVERGVELPSDVPDGADPVQVSTAPGDAPIESDFRIAGTAAANASLQLIINGNADSAYYFDADASGNWSTTLPVQDYGRLSNYFEVFDAENRQLSERVLYTSLVTEPDIVARLVDPDGDDTGPTGNYGRPTQQQSRDQKDILAVEARTAGRNLELVLTMKETSNPWKPPNGFDNVAISTFIDLPGRDGATALPLLNAAMPGDSTWSLAHVGYGWASYTYTDTGATAERQGEKLGVSPALSTDVESNSITLFFDGARLGVDSWEGATVYVTTWDTNGEGTYVPITTEFTEWFFKAENPDGPKVMDDALLKIE